MLCDGELSFPAKEKKEGKEVNKLRTAERKRKEKKIKEKKRKKRDRPTRKERDIETERCAYKGKIAKGKTPTSPHSAVRLI